MAKIPTPFIGGTESPRRGSDEGKKLQLPFSPQEEGAVEPEAAPADVDEQAPSEPPIRIEMDASGAEESSLAEFAGAKAEFAEPELVETAPEPSAAGLEMPDFLLGPDSAAQEDALDLVGAEEQPDASDELAEMARALQEGEFGSRIRELIDELGTSPPDDAVPRAFAAGYLAAKKLKEE